MKEDVFRTEQKLKRQIFVAAAVVLAIITAIALAVMAGGRTNDEAKETESVCSTTAAVTTTKPSATTTAQQTTKNATTNEVTTKETITEAKVETTIEQIATETYEEDEYEDSYEDEESYDDDSDEYEESYGSWEDFPLWKYGRISGPSGTETYYNQGEFEDLVYNAYCRGFDPEDYPYWIDYETGCRMFGSYIIVAANRDVHPFGSLVQTSLGMGISIDTGSFAYDDPYQIDVAVIWPTPW